MIRTESLTDALGASDARMVTFVGAGGKTSAILRIAEELVARDRTVIVTTTTLVGERFKEHASTEILLDDRTGAVRPPLVRSGCAFFHAGLRSDGKYAGVPEELLDVMFDLQCADCILVEGDGARGLPVKMPDVHEPVIPVRSDVVVPVVGMDALDRPIAEGSVHRPDLFGRLGTGASVTPDTIVSLLSSTSGGMKSVPAAACVRPLLNKTTLPGGERAELIAQSLLRSAPDAVDRVVCGDVQTGAFRVFRRTGAPFVEPRPSEPVRS